MAVPKPPNFDAAGWTARLKEAIPKRPDGTTIAVWDQLPPFVKWIRGQRDILDTHRIQLDDQKAHLDRLDEREKDHHAVQATEIAALKEAVKNPPFPG